MTKDAFVATIATKPQFIKWAKAPVAIETLGGIEKWHGIAYINTGDGTNTYNVYFMVDTATGEATWQQNDPLQPENNAATAKEKALEAYLKANFAAHFVNRFDLNNNWAEATVYTISGADLAKSTVLVFKQGANPITHRKVV